VSTKLGRHRRESVISPRRPLVVSFCVALSSLPSPYVLLAQMSRRYRSTAPHDDFLSDSDDSSPSDPVRAVPRFRDDEADEVRRITSNAASISSLSRPRSASHKKKSSSEAEDGSGPRSAAGRSTGGRVSGEYELGSSNSSEGEEDDEKLVGSGKGLRKRKRESNGARKVWTMRSLGDDKDGSSSDDDNDEDDVDVSSASCRCVDPCS
jgi:hypothetical protein